MKTTIRRQKPTGQRPAHYGLAATADGQEYTLLPNPNEGTFVLRQKNAEGGITTVVIYDAVGRTIYTGRVDYAGGQGKVALPGTAPGLYLLKMQDEKGRIFMFKFIVK